MDRLMLWFGNYYNVPTEFFQIPTITPNGLRNGDIDLTISSSNNVPSSDPPHLYFKDAAILYGGQRSRQVNECVDQCPHFDIPEIKVGEKTYSVAANPRLSGLFKPCSLIFALCPHSSRDLFIQDGVTQNTKVEVNFNEMLIFGGHKVHGGKTYADNDQKNHPSLHLFVMSTKHDVPVDTFQLCNETIAYCMPHHIPLLTVARQLTECKLMRGKLTKFYTHAMLNKNGNKTMTTEIMSFITELKKLVKVDGRKCTNEVQTLVKVHGRKSPNEVITLAKVDGRKSTDFQVHSFNIVDSGYFGVHLEVMAKERIVIVASVNPDTVGSRSGVMEGDHLIGKFGESFFNMTNNFRLDSNQRPYQFKVIRYNELTEQVKACILGHRKQERKTSLQVDSDSEW